MDSDLNDLADLSDLSSLSDLSLVEAMYAATMYATHKNHNQQYLYQLLNEVNK